MEYAAIARDGLILTEKVLAQLEDQAYLRRGVESGVLIKLRRGTFVERSTWEAADARARHILRIRAVLAVAQRPVTIAGVSAAAVWGMPIGADWPTEVTVLDEWRGGGRSEPGVLRTSAGFATARTVVREGVTVTDLARTAIDVARSTATEFAIGSVDWALWRRNPLAVTKEELTDELHRLALRSHRRRAERTVREATWLSDSYGESRARAVIAQLGFAPPQLQAEFRDDQGLIVTDFAWPFVGVVAEFDGKQKYTCDRYTAGDPGEVLWREKKRQDRLQRLGLDVVRVLWGDLEHPERLLKLLMEAGVPRG